MPVMPWVEPHRLVATGEPGAVVAGPGLAVPAGSYRARFRGRGRASPGRLVFRVEADGGAAVLAQAVVDPVVGGAELDVELAFALDRTRDDVDLVVVSAGGARLELAELTLARR